MIGHRGAAGLAPENTLASIEIALKTGVDAIEIDVRLLENNIIVLHDETIDRTTSGKGHYKSMTLGRLRALDAGGGPIPLLQEVIELIDGRADLHVEVKEPGIATEVIATLSDATVSRSRWRSHIVLSSFDAATTDQLAHLRNDMHLAILYEGDYDAALGKAEALGAYSIHVPLHALNAADIGQAHQSEIRVFVYTVNDRNDINRCAEARVDGVFSDYPDRVVAFNQATLKGFP